MIFRWRNFDWVLFGALLFIAATGLVTLASSSQVFFQRQLLWLGFAALVIIFGSQLDWRFFVKQSWFRYGIYWLTVGVLIFANLQGGTVRGTKSWIVFGGFQFEPSELAKLALIILLAGFFSRRHIEAWLSRNILLSFGYMIIPAGLILVQPDLGSAVTVVGIWLGFLLASGINKKRLAIGVGLALLVIMFFWFSILKPYQKDRITAFLFPSHDPLGINYNVTQAKIAIGSAGIFGKGFGGGTQTKLNFLPVAKTDFLFAAFVEEWGILGGLALIAAFSLVVYRLVVIGLRVRDNYSGFVILGGGLFLVIHFFINIGSNIGLIPVTGLTFPFFSYGGSNLLTTATLMSIIEHIKLESSV
jgi:rod shape determining protein RodA